jgi:hypothetical protein
LHGRFIRPRIRDEDLVRLEEANVLFTDVGKLGEDAADVPPAFDVTFSN